jgi:hypothetical protein
MKTWLAVLLTIALYVLSSLITFDIGGRAVSLSWFMVLGTSIWVAIDSSKMQLQRYKSGISYGPVVLFFCGLVLWIIAFPWYLSMRYKIQNGTAILRDVPNVAA